MVFSLLIKNLKRLIIPFIHLIFIECFLCARHWGTKEARFLLLKGQWSGQERQTINKQTNKWANFRLKKCYKGMKQDDRMEWSWEVRVTLYKVVKECLSEKVIVKLRWGKNILERETDKCKALCCQKHRTKVNAVGFTENGEGRQDEVSEVGRDHIS